MANVVQALMADSPGLAEWVICGPTEVGTAAYAEMPALAGWFSCTDLNALEGLLARAWALSRALPNELERRFQRALAAVQATDALSHGAADALRRLKLRGRVAGADALPRAADVTPQSALRAGRDFGPLALSARAFAGVAPEHKYLLVQALRQSGYVVGFAGDGANDAPALAAADCGVAVVGATDAARAAADVVLTSPGLAPLLGAVLAARATFAPPRALRPQRPPRPAAPARPEEETPTPPSMRPLKIGRAHLRVGEQVAPRA
jgi:hypothetical protein